MWFPVNEKVPFNMLMGFPQIGSTVEILSKVVVNMATSAPDWMKDDPEIARRKVKYTVKGISYVYDDDSPLKVPDVTIEIE
jgi:hypothetical protein